MYWVLIEENQLLAKYRAWFGSELFKENDREVYLRAVFEVIKSARGEPPDTIPPTVRLAQINQYWNLFVGVADSFACQWLAPHLSMIHPGWTFSNDGTFQSEIGELRPMVPVRLLNANTATIGELADLPGLGPITAARIVARRKTLGKLSGIEDLVGIQGLSRSSREQAVHYLSFFDAPIPLGLHPPELLIPDATVGFVQYIHILHRSGFQLAETSTVPLDMSLTKPGLLARELERLIDTVRARPHWDPDRRMDVPDMLRMTKAANRSRSLEQYVENHDTPSSRLGGVGLVRNAAYIDLALHLISNATERVWLQMFYFTAPGTTSPGDELMSALEQAVARGVDVRVILDVDLESDYHGALRINQAVVDDLKARAIPIRLDTVGRTTHSKVLLVDSNRLLLGTHNWTIGSFYRQDDTSLYIEGQEPCQKEAQRFSYLWDAYDPDPTRRTVHFPMLIWLTPNERSQLASKGFSDSQTFLNAHHNQSRVLGTAAELAIDEKRLLRLWRIIKLMQHFLFPEPTAFALTLTPVDSPSEFRQTARATILDHLRNLPPLPEPYSTSPIRLDVVEASDA